MRSLSRRHVILSLAVLGHAHGVTVAAQAPGPRIDLDGLALDSLGADVPVLFSRGYDSRARFLGDLIAGAQEYAEARLGIRPDVRIALLDPADFRRAVSGAPYGMPFIADQTAVLPADLEAGAVVDAYRSLEPTASADVLGALGRLDLSFPSGAELMVDLVALHELGHAQVAAYGIDPRQPWFGEFLATYLGYAYLRTAEPDLASVWDALAEAGRSGFEPAYTSLDDLNRLYVGVGPSNYVWYQDQLQGRARDVFDAHGLDFVRSVKQGLADVELSPTDAAPLLELLDGIAPGFVTWSNELGQDRQGP